ncbi:MAG: hypothetical protein BGO29_09100 [Bacteroidales bacterium 36-12]|nr:MAG: hypothetical protein BGO29_09100 [Bacteroidales bacterium 36-12]
MFFFSAINIVLSVILLIYNWRFNKNIFFFAAFLVLISMESLMVSIFSFGGNSDVYTILVILSPLFFLKAPMIYFFARGMVDDKFYFRTRDYLHFIPFFFHLLANLPFLFYSYEVQHSIAAAFIQNHELFREARLSFYPIGWNNTARTLQMLIYLILSFLVLKRTKFKIVRMKGQLKFQYIYTKNKLTFILFIILAISVLSVALDFLFISNVNNIHVQNTMNIIIHLMMYAYCIIPVYIIMNPKFLYGLPHLETHYLSSLSQKAASQDEINSENIEQSNTNNDIDYYLNLANKIMQYIDNERPYLSPKFSINDIHSHFNVSPQYIFYCLHEVLHISLDELKNEKRISYAKNILRAEGVDTNIELLSKRAGFNSKSTFLQAFKKDTGLTPHQWVKNNNLDGGGR